MSAQLTQWLLAACAGSGTLALKGSGASVRPWLTIRRLETQKSYLDHQLRALRKLHEGPIKAAIDRCNGSGFYDVLRLRAGSTAFERAYELLYPQDVRQWSEQSIGLCAEAGLMMLWLDHGQFTSEVSGVIRPPWSTEELLLWCEQLLSCKIPAAPVIDARSGKITGLRLGVTGLEALTSRIRPLVHRTMRERLRPRKMLGRKGPIG